jgi:hypothetical protein
MAGFGSRAKWGAVGALAVLVAAAAWWGKSDDATHSAAPGATAAPGLAASAAAGGKLALTKPLWKDLTLAQQIALEPLQSEWDAMVAVRKKKWLDIANRYSSMKPDEQTRVHERMAEWVKMTPEQRSQVRRNFSRAQKIEPGQKSAQWEEYQQLPDEQKKELAAKAATKKQVVNLPTPAQSKMKTVEPIKHPNAVHVPAPLTLPAPAPAAAPSANGGAAGGDAAGSAGAAGAAGSGAASAAAGAAASASQPNASNVPPVPPAPPANVK